MARLRTIGFETGDSSEVDSSSVLTIGSGAGLARTGTYYAVMGQSGSMRVDFPLVDEVIAAFAVQVTQTPASTAYLTTARLRNNTTNIVTLGYSNLLSFSIAVHGVTVFTFDANSGWNHIQILLRRMGTTGYVEARHEGVSAGSWTGTVPEISPEHLYFSTQTTYQIRLDDIVINDSVGPYNDSWPGTVRLVPALINGDGGVTQLSRGGTDSGANWNQVDEIPASDLDFVYSGDVGKYDLYTVAPISLNPGISINNVTLVARARVEDGTGSSALLLKTGDDLMEGDLKSQSSTFKSQSSTFPRDEGGVVWTEARFNLIEIGPIVKPPPE
jgi:hypothetical protein